MKFTPSPFATSAIVFAIIVGAVCAPLILPILGVAYLAQRRLNGQRRAAYDRAYAKAMAKRDREYHEALRYFAS